MLKSSVRNILKWNGTQGRDRRIRYGRAECRVNNNFIRKPKTWPKEITSSDKMKDVYEQIKKDLRPKYKKLYNMGKINKKERHIMFKDEVNRIFAERFGIEYGFELYE